MRVILTRPAGQSAAWLPVFRQAGWVVQEWPLLTLSPVRDGLSVEAVRSSVARVQSGYYQAVMFVSRAAVQALWAQMPQPSVPQTASPWPAMAWATGPGTRHALLEQGLAPAQIVCPADDAVQFDSEALWALVAAQVQPGWRVLIVRGQDEDGGASPPSTAGSGRDWLAQQLHSAGARVDFVVAYERAAPVWSPEQQAQALQSLADGASVWVFSSSLGIRHLHDLLPSGSVAAHADTARAVVTHERIAEQALLCGWRHVLVSKPQAQAVLQVLQG